MFENGESPQSRLSRANEVAEAWWRRQAAGEHVHEADVIAAHPDLSPELAEQIRFLRLLQKRRPDLGNASILHASNSVAAARATTNERANSDTLLPGTILADRYIISRKLGEGGLGEVYLAYDQSLRKDIAIKLLRRRLTVTQTADKNRNHNDEDIELTAREHLIREVQLAQRVSHINVCRIHDVILDADPPILTMEYIDGEDLDQTLIRIGRFVPERAHQIAIEICRGLAAAHQQGVIHRDLKPRNIMLDGAGLVRITDFGLARVNAVDDAHELAGTQAYMAPEQRRGEGTTEQSDIYSLGLILFEVYTGTFPNLPRLSGSRSATNELTSPSQYVPSIDPAVDKTIQRCLADSPTDRPSSARAVLAELTGKVDSKPAPIEDRVFSRVRWMAIVAVMGVLASWITSSTYQMINHVDFQLESAEAFRNRAIEIIVELGHELQAGRDKRAWRFGPSARFRNEPAWANRAISYWYRQSEEPLEPSRFELTRNQGTTRVRRNDPPWNVSGMAGVELSPDGLLLEYRSTSPPSAQLDSDFAQQQQPTETLRKLFSFAGLQFHDFEQVELDTSRTLKTSFGPLESGQFFHSKLTSDQETAPYVFVKLDGDRVVWFRRWSEDIRSSKGTKAGDDINDALFAFLIVAGIAGIWFARQYKRGDGSEYASGKFSAAVVFSSLAASILFTAQHQSTVVGEVTILQYGLCNAMFWATVVWCLHVAVEPYLQREHPRCLNSWSRLIRGRFQDPVVVTDVMMAVMLATISAPVLAGTHAMLREAFDWPARYGIPPASMSALSSPIAVGALACDSLADSFYFSLGLLVLPMALKKLLGNFWLAALVAWSINSIFYGLYFGGGIEPTSDRYLFFAYMSTWAALHLYVALRFGLLPIVVFTWISNFMFRLPFTLEHWYADSALVGSSMLIIGIAAYAGWFLIRNGAARTSSSLTTR